MFIILPKDSKYSGRWTDSEHQKFIEGLELYGRNWKKIQQLIGTRTCAQIRSHAQKFFKKSRIVENDNQEGLLENQEEHKEEDEDEEEEQIIQVIQKSQKSAQNNYSYFMQKMYFCVNIESVQQQKIKILIFGMNLWTQNVKLMKHKQKTKEKILFKQMIIVMKPKWKVPFIIRYYKMMDFDMFFLSFLQIFYLFSNFYSQY